MKLIFCYLLVCVLISCANLERIKLYTYSPIKNYNFFPLRTKRLVFNMRCEENAHILLSNGYSYSEHPTYEIVLGSWANTVSYFRKDGVNVVEHKRPVLDKNTFRRFWVDIDDENGCITVGTGSNTTLIHYQDPNYVQMSYFGLTASGGRTAEWDFDFDLFNCEKSSRQTNCFSL